jgi:YVTN family beta-propeller protein
VFGRHAGTRGARNLALAAGLSLAVRGLAGAANDATLLPTEWTLSPAGGPLVATGTLPQSALLTADGEHLIVLEAGAGPAAIRILDPVTLATEHVVPLVSGAFGNPLADATGSGFWASAGGADSLLHVDAARGTIDRTIALPHDFWPSGIARSPDGGRLAVSGDLANAVVFIDLAAGTVGRPIATGRHPAGLAFAPGGATLYVANWGEASLSVIDARAQTTRAPIAVGLHPESLLLARDGTKLFVAESDDDAIGVVDLARGLRVTGANVGLYGGTLFGASPVALALSPDGSRLFVACPAADAVAVLRVDGAEPAPIGAIPTGWYPTALALNRSGTTLYVADGMGESSHANPSFDPFAPFGSPRFNSGYVATTAAGSIRRIGVPNDATLAAETATVGYNGGPYLLDTASDENHRLHGPAGADPGRAVVSTGGPILHVIYVIKENRTYDQVLGDLPGANGDPSLALFGAAITPNEHALAQRFGIFDDTFADAEISPDGHNWSTAAFANDYLEKMWPQVTAGRRALYDFEDKADASVPHSGYLWDAAARAGRSLRNYGEFVTNPGQPGGPVVSHMRDLREHTDPRYVGYDLSYSDLDREAEWEREYRADERYGAPPALQIVRLPDDHTAGTRVGLRTPAAMVASNDLALGRLVDTVSHSRDWADTLIVAVEDDAQNGPDHVDQRRMPIFFASPYAKGGVLHQHYSTAGILRTIELILGLAPLSAYDASANPLYAAFTPVPDLRPFDALPPSVDLDARNAKTAYRAADSARLDLSHEDRAPAATMNDIVWRAVRGANAPLPRYGAFDR